MIAAAVAVILHDGDEGLETLFIHRAVRSGDTWSGQIAFPGGRREGTDTDLRATAIRETSEEVGVDLAGAEPLGVLDDLHPRTPTLPPVVVRPFVFALTDTRPPARSHALDSIDPFRFTRDFRAVEYLDDAIELQKLKPQERATSLAEIAIDHPGIPRRVFPAYTLGKHTIWGMSERILTPLISLVS